MISSRSGQGVFMRNEFSLWLLCSPKPLLKAGAGRQDDLHVGARDQHMEQGTSP